MNKVRASAPQLEGLVPYDPKYLPAEAYLSANENPRDVDAEVRAAIARRIAQVPLNRYPDPLANRLRDLIAEANGLDRANVLLGNGGDELLFDVALAWGGPGRSFLNLPPTFSVYAANARLTNTRCVDVPRRADFSIDEAAVLERVGKGDIDFVIVTSPNNPTGQRASTAFIEELLDATDALVLVDEAYFEFSRATVRPLLATHENLAILRTFSKAFSLAGARLGYVLANAPVIEERGRVMEALRTLPGVTAYPSDSNWILFSMEDAGAAWQYLYDRGVLVRDFSSAPMLEGCLRATIGTPEQNDAFIRGLRDFLAESRAQRARAMQ